MQVLWRGGWWEARVMSRSMGGALLVRAPPEPEGENETWEASAWEVCA